MKLIIATLTVMFIGLFTMTLNSSQEVEEVFEPTEVYIDYNKLAARKVAPHVVRLEAMDQSGVTLGTGTGSHIMFKGMTYILTNKHMCEETNIQERTQGDMKGILTITTQFRVKVTGGKEFKILKISKNHDLCLLTSDRYSGITIAELDVEKFEHVTVVGHPRGLPLTIRHGNVVSKEVSQFPWVSAEPINFLFINIIAYGGNSGSPVTNDKGELIGVLFGGFRNEHTEAFVVPLTDVKLFLNEYSLGR